MSLPPSEKIKASVKVQHYLDKYVPVGGAPGRPLPNPAPQMAAKPRPRQDTPQTPITLDELLNEAVDKPIPKGLPTSFGRPPRDKPNKPTSSPIKGNKPQFGGGHGGAPPRGGGRGGGRGQGRGRGLGRKDQGPRHGRYGREDAGRPGPARHPHPHPQHSQGLPPSQPPNRWQGGAPQGAPPRYPQPHQPHHQGHGIPGMPQQNPTVPDMGLMAGQPPYTGHPQVINQPQVIGQPQSQVIVQSQVTGHDPGHTAIAQDQYSEYWGQYYRDKMMSEESQYGARAIPPSNRNQSPGNAWKHQDKKHNDNHHDNRIQPGYFPDSPPSEDSNNQDNNPYLGDHRGNAVFPRRLPPSQNECVSSDSTSPSPPATRYYKNADGTYYQEQDRSNRRHQRRASPPSNQRYSPQRTTRRSNQRRSRSHDRNHSSRSREWGRKRRRDSRERSPRRRERKESPVAAPQALEAPRVIQAMTSTGEVIYVTLMEPTIGQGQSQGQGEGQGVGPPQGHMGEIRGDERGDGGRSHRSERDSEPMDMCSEPDSLTPTEVIPAPHDPHRPRPPQDMIAPNPHPTPWGHMGPRVPGPMRPPCPGPGFNPRFNQGGPGFNPHFRPRVPPLVRPTRMMAPNGPPGPRPPDLFSPPVRPGLRQDNPIQRRLGPPPFSYPNTSPNSSPNHQGHLGHPGHPGNPGHQGHPPTNTHTRWEPNVSVYTLYNIPPSIGSG